MEDDEPAVAGVERAGAPGSAAESSDVDHPAEPDAGERTWFAWLALSAVAVALAATIFALRPDGDPTATGPDTTIVERDGDTTLDSAISVPSASVAPTSSIEPAPAEPADSFERRPFDGFIAGAVAYNGGWLAFGSGGIVWSANGLDWGPFDERVSRELFAWSLVDGQLLFPVLQWADEFDTEESLQEFEFSVWSFEDDSGLRPVPEYGAYRGISPRSLIQTSAAGGVFGVLLSGSVQDMTRRAEISEYLGQWLTPEEIAESCRAVRAAVETLDDSDGFVNAVEFRNCEEETVATILTADMGGRATNELLGCLNSYITPVVTQSQHIRLGRNLPPVIELFEPGEDVALALVTPDGLLVLARSASPGACDANALATGPATTLELRPTSGQAVEIDLSFLDGESFRPWLVPLPDGSALLQTDFEVYRLTPGAQDFEKIVTTPFAGSLIDYVVDGRFFAQSGSNGAISGIDGAWTTFDLGSPTRASLVVAGDDFVVLEVGGSELVKIPVEPSAA